MKQLLTALLLLALTATMAQAQINTDTYLQP